MRHIALEGPHTHLARAAAALPRHTHSPQKAPKAARTASAVLQKSSTAVPPLPAHSLFPRDSTYMYSK